MGNSRIPFEPETLYHVYNHGNGMDSVFQKEENYLYFLKKYAFYLAPVSDTFAYCLMPNHFHFLIRIKPESVLLPFFIQQKQERDKSKLADSSTPQGFQTLAGFSAADLPKLISKQFADFLNGYSQAFNKQQNRKGSLFLDNIQRKKVTDDSYFTKLVHYIHTNPVHHGFVNELSDWRFSSFHSLLSLKKTQLQREEVLNWFGGKENYLAFHEQAPDPKLIVELSF